MKGITEARSLLIDALLYLELSFELEEPPINGVDRDLLVWCAHQSIQKALQGSEISEHTQAHIESIKTYLQGRPDLRIV